MTTIRELKVSQVFCVVVVGIFVFWLSTDVQAGPKEEVAAATERWIKALNDTDLETIVSLYAPDAVFWATTSQTIRTNPGGVRAYFAKGFGSDEYTLTMKIAEQHIRVYGDIGLNSGIYKAHIVMKDGKIWDLPFRFSFAYQKRGNEWVIVDHHSSRMPKPRKKKRK